MSTALPQTEMPIPAPLVFAKSAARKVWELIEEEGNPNLMLRVYVTGGGCSGFQYGFTFDETINADDTVIEKSIKKAANDEQIEEDEDEDGDSGTGTILVRLLVDPMSLQYLAGAKIRYEKSLKGEQFVISNPNAKTTCGCGSSFAA
jgi:iron-sulfur cluster insertion protein